MSSRTLLATAALAALLPLAAQASSGADVIARSSVAGNGPGGASLYSWNYYVDHGFYGGGQSSTSTGSASGTATTATAQAHDTGADAAGQYAASSTADANLATATVAATATNSGFVIGHRDDEGHPYAEIDDTLTFTNATATASTISTFDVTFTIHDNVTIAAGVPANADGSYLFSTFAFNGGDARGEVYVDSNGALALADDTYPSAWVGTWTVTGGHDKTLTFTGHASFQGTTWITPFRETTELDCYDGVQCANDASVAFSLPTGVTLSSESGVFPTVAGVSAVPEPQNAMLLLAGLGILGAALRRRASRARG